VRVAIDWQGYSRPTDCMPRPAQAQRSSEVDELGWRISPKTHRRGRAHPVCLILPLTHALQQSASFTVNACHSGAQSTACCTSERSTTLEVAHDGSLPRCIAIVVCCWPGHCSGGAACVARAVSKDGKALAGAAKASSMSAIRKETPRQKRVIINEGWYICPAGRSMTGQPRELLREPEGVYLATTSEDRR
jgi:hypothetical protein